MIRVIAMVAVGHIFQSIRGGIARKNPPNSDIDSKVIYSYLFTKKSKIP
ncbi:hypothetical protein [Gilliamella mensalis]|nr:hypothetical protein [Gilliamella mensalis]